MKLGASELLALAQGAGTGGDPQTAVAVALAESGGDPAAKSAPNADQWRSIDRGLWQINDHWHPEVTDACAYDAACNARAAYAISNGWTDFSPWSTYQSGGYQQFMPQVATVQQAAPTGRSLYGQTVVGEMLTSPWFPGSWEVTQGWGPTDYAGEPEGHGYTHWHAGVDVGVDCGTTISLPAGLSGRARAMDNPDGYGTALIILIDGGPGILLGHLRQRLVDDDQVVTGGTQLAITNSTGNSTGCHVHFEVRPQDPKRSLGIGAYGTDVDPSQWLVTGQAGSSSAELLAFNPTQGITDAFGRAVGTLVSGAQVLLGAALVVGGLVVTAYGIRGGTPQELQRDVGRQARSLSKPRARERPERPDEPSPAAETRIRPDLQRTPAGASVPANRATTRGRPVLRTKSTAPERRREAQLDSDLAARMAARRQR